MGNPAEAAGPVVIGIIINTVLLGVMSAQVYLYFTSFKNDRVWIKTFVAFLLLCDVVNSVCNVIGLYDTFVLHFGDFDALGTITPHPAFTGCIAALTQTFYGWRIYALTRRRTLALFIIALALAGGIAGVLIAVRIKQTPQFVLLIDAKVIRVIITPCWYQPELVAGSEYRLPILRRVMRYFDHRHPRAVSSKQRTGFRRTDMLVDRIIRLTIQTGMLTAIFAAINLLVYLLDPTALHLLFNFPLSKLYSNSLMSTLNSRGVFMRSARDETGSSISALSYNTSTTEQTLRAAAPSDVKSIALFGHSTGPRVEVNVNVESVEMQDRQKHGLVPEDV